MFLEELENFNFWHFVLLLLDIGLVAFLFYRIFLLLNRTRAFQLLFGVLLLLLTDVMARYLELLTLSWIITNVSTYLVIGLIVLMQPELRRLVAGLEQKELFGWLYPTKSLPINEITNAARSMAAKRIGSIIVILRNLRPQTIIEQSVPLNSEISTELIETIFWKDSPLHDGAVIVEGKRIVAASCYLPLSNSTKLKKTHGARHRAGLGISEETDAIVIVTSEESGRISVLLNGNIFSPKAAELRIFVQNLLSKKQRKGIIAQKAGSG